MLLPAVLVELMSVYILSYRTVAVWIAMRQDRRRRCRKTPWSHTGIQYGERRTCSWVGTSVNLRFIRVRSLFTRRRIYSKLARFSKCAIPTRRSSHFHWRRAYRALHIGIELEDGVVTSNAVVGEYKTL